MGSRQGRLRRLPSGRIANTGVPITPRAQPEGRDVSYRTPCQRGARANQVPIVGGRPSARFLIISQAPGRRVSETRLSFNDRSGDRLRAWLAIDRETFCDEAQVAILGIAFCFPGLDGKGGDLPARSHRR